MMPKIIRKSILALALLASTTLSHYAHTGDRPNLSAAEIHEPAPNIKSLALEIQDYLNAGVIHSSLNNFRLVEADKAMQSKLVQYQSDFEQSAILESIKSKALQGKTLPYSKAIQQELSAEQEWTYLHYRTDGTNQLLTYYVTIGEMGNYVTVKIKEIDGAWMITDWHSHAMELWMSELMAGFMDYLVFYGRQDDPEVFANAMHQFQGKAASPVIPTQIPNKNIEKILISSQLTFSLLNAENQDIEPASTVAKKAKPSDFSLIKAALSAEDGDYKTALQHLDRLTSQVGNNSYLMSTKIEYLQSDQQYKAAINTMVELIESFGHHEDSYYMLLVLLSQQQMFDEAIKVIEVLQSGFNVELDRTALTEIAELQALIQSQQFIDWHSSRS